MELDRLTNRLELGAISRREFMTRAGTLGASAAFISTFPGGLATLAADSPKKGEIGRAHV